MEEEEEEEEEEELTLAIHGGTPVRAEPLTARLGLGEEEVAALENVVRSGSLSNPWSKGAWVEEFEIEFGARHGRDRSIAVESGAAAMHVCVAALDPEPGDEIITTAWPSFATMAGLLLQRCVPVVVDIDETWNLDPLDVERRITTRTRAIVAAHVCGNPCDMKRLRELSEDYGLFLIEDCCQALFAERSARRVGTFGDLAGFSFVSEHISAGLGGAVLVNNRALWDRAVAFCEQGLPRPHGPFSSRPYAHYLLGPNYAINDLIGAVLLEQLGKIDPVIERTIAHVEHLKTLIADIPEVVPQPVRDGDRHSYHVAGFVLDPRLGCSAKTFCTAIGAEGIPMSVGHGAAGQQQRSRSNSLRFHDGSGDRFSDRVGHRSCGERVMNRAVGFRPSPTLTGGEVEDIALAIRKVTAHYRVNESASDA